jgi:NADH-quinone oxidoreductase subunit E
VGKKSLIEKLHDLQDQNKNQSYLTQEALVNLAKEEKISPAKVFAVATFYSMFSTTPRGKHIIRVCEDQACHLDGAETVIQTLERLLKVQLGDTTNDGLFTLEHSSCLGLCDQSPAMMIDSTAYGNLTRTKIEAIINEIKAGA